MTQGVFCLEKSTMFKEWFTELIKGLLTNDGSPMFRIIANIVGSFLIYAIYIVLAGFTQRLKKKNPNASEELESKIVEKMLLWSTIILMAFLLLTGIVVAFKALFQEIWLQGNEGNASEISLKQAIGMSLNHFKHVALYVFGSMLLMAIFTTAEAIFILSNHRGPKGKNLNWTKKITISIDSGENSRNAIIDCPACDRLNSTNVVFCTNCGHQLKPAKVDYPKSKHEPKD